MEDEDRGMGSMLLTLSPSALSDLFAPMKRLPGSVANHKTWPSLPGPKRTYSSSLIMPIRSS